MKLEERAGTYVNDDGLLVFRQRENDADAVPHNGAHVRREVRRQVLRKPIRKNRARNRNTDNATKQLTPADNGSSLRDHMLAVGELGLDRNDRVLQRAADTDAEQYLVSDDLGVGRIFVDGVEQAGADGHEERAEDEEGPVPALCVDDAAGSHSSEHRGELEGQNVNTRAGKNGSAIESRASRSASLPSSAVSLCLVPQRQVVDRQQQAEEDEEGLEDAAKLSPVLQQVQRQNRIVAHMPLPQTKDDNQRAKDAEARNDRLVAPRLRLAAPLERQEQRRDEPETQNRPDDVDFPPLLERGEVSHLGTPTGVSFRQEEQNGCDRQATESGIKSTRRSVIVTIFTYGKLM